MDPARAEFRDALELVNSAPPGMMQQVLKNMLDSLESRGANPEDLPGQAEAASLSGGGTPLTDGPRAVVDAWMGFVVPQAVSRNRVQVVGLTGRPELNGQHGTIGVFNEAKARFPVKLEGGESVLIKMVNLMSI